MKIISATDRLQEQKGIKGQIWGRFGSGKTSQLWTLDPKTTLCADLEAGMKAVQGWEGRSISIRDWEGCVNLACWIGGPNPANRPDEPYSQQHYDFVQKEYGDFPKDVETVFVDSTSNAGRYCLNWAKGQPQAFSDKTGKLDMRGAYGLLGQAFIAWAEQLQHIGRLNVWLVGGLDEKTDDFKRSFWSPMLEGTKGSNALPYIFDEVITLADMATTDGKPYRAFVCTGPNEWGYPAKDRSGCLEQIEEPHLGRLMDKIAGGKQINLPSNFTYAIPTQGESSNE